ncbi:J domain-containing protein [Dyella telluris]|uniref:J domain-containing protein n=1 Tax=Dyella telluris TaxID=2763498 RepID=A0A7G8Q4B0_9GAMM|nr:J domain-containing protein [Dyella telluris]QNK01618.1 J domain-containing protein [Dyella telluris]
MTHETDFLDLYRRLGLDPGCELDALKQAYRRHVAALHPDRRQGAPADDRAAARLQRLTAQYGAAMDFHRRHGRLPGAPQVASPGMTETRSAHLGETREPADPFAGRQVPAGHADGWHETVAPPGHRPRARLAVVLLAVALLTLGWMWHESSPTSPTSTPDSADAEAPDQRGAGNMLGEPAPTGAVLCLGMSPDDVRDIEGEPDAVHGRIWEYGPSWIRFDNDQVVEWHESPLRPLHVAAIGPAR